MKTFKQFLAEAKQTGTLYHYTSPSRAINILNDNSLRNFSNSFTRKKTLHKERLDFAQQPQVNSVPVHLSFEINGDKLSENYKISPFNAYPKAQGRYSKNSFLNAYDTKPNEQEERISRRNVDNFKSYIKKIRIHYPISDQHLQELQKHNIPIEYT